MAIAAAAEKKPAPILIGSAHAPEEREADRIADALIAPVALGPTACTACAGADAPCPACAGGAGKLRRSPLGPAAPAQAPPAVARALAAPGVPLPDRLRAKFERRLGAGADLSPVRLHMGETPARAAASVNAQAFALGRDIVLGGSAPDLGSAAGERLLAHEVAHTLQDGDAAPTLRRQDAPGVPQASPSVPAASASRTAGANPFAGIERSSPAAMRELCAALDAAPAEAAMVTLTVAGRTGELTAAQLRQLRAATASAIEGELRRAENRSTSAMESYKSQRRVNEEFPLVSRAVMLFGGVSDPELQLQRSVSVASVQVGSARAALSGGRLANALDALENAADSAEHAGELSYAYRDGIITAGERQVRVLEFTRNASFVALGVLAIIVTGGTAAAAAGGGGAAAGGGTAVAFGVNLGVGATTAANVIATGAPIVATLGSAGVQAALGEEVDWGRVAVDVAVSLVLARFGGRLANKVFAGLGGNPAVQSMGRVAFTRAFAAVITHEASTVFSTAVEATYNLLRGRRVTWEAFLDNLATRLSDPYGLVIAAVMGGAVGVVESRTARAALPPAPDESGSGGRTGTTATRSGTEAEATTTGTSRRSGTGRTAATATDTEPAPGSEAQLRRSMARAVDQAMDRPVSPATRQQIETELAQLRAVAERVETARRSPASLTPEQRQALAAADAEIEALRFGPSSTIRRGGGGSEPEAAWRDGAQQVRAWVAAGEDLTLERIVALNRTVSRGDPEPASPGLRSVDVRGGNDPTRTYVPAEHVDPSMQRFLVWYNGARGRLTPVELAAQSYQRLVSIHPFENANGRTTRLVMDWIMRANGLPEAPLPAREHNVAVFGYREIVAPGTGVTPDTVALSLLRGLRDALTRIPESIRGPMP